MADKLKPLLEAARKSSWGMKKLNFIMHRMIPFNRPHRIELMETELTRVSAKIPYIKKNFNHIKGTHACGLATVGEYCAGLLLLSNLSPDKYRIIMRSLKAEYHYQAKMDAIATYELSESDLTKHIVDPLKKESAIYHTCNVEVLDTDKNKIANIITEWQIKSWDKVKLKV
ncbi:MAG: acyl-coenzyme A thioesterase PaaI-like protein [Patiriisocius sp.]|jgi:acyl-coenzyme A thioesterase PaaI-like protein